MSYANYPCYADVIEESFIEEQCLDLLANLKVVMDKVDVSFDTFAQCFDESWGNDPDSLGIDDEEHERLTEAYEKLQKDFEAKTGLTLLTIYTVAEDEADRGCDVTGGCWCVGNVYELTAAGKKYKDKIEKATWTVGG
ncbi:hypothetical protein LCGC14_0579710 [marine sediment metagenome]|uniref:Uncharacterized protein n=1 Tax=marine sediment metagenome TaxID=412755 RepID=A0A0F9RLP8_9ZZZZ